MASNSIHFKIGSEFSGEGFKRARSAIVEVNKNAKGSVETMSKVATAMGGMDNAAGKAMGAITGLIQSFTQGGIQGAAFAGVMMLVNYKMEAMKAEAAELAERMNKVHAAVEKTFNTTLSGRMASINAEVKSIRDGFEQVTKQANAMTAALEGVRQANAQGGIAQLKVEELNKMLEAHTEAERQSIEKSYALQIAIAQREEVERAASEKVSQAAEAVAQSQMRMANIDDAWAKVKDERKSLEETLAVARASEDSHAVEIQRRVNELKAKEAELLAQREAVEGQTEVLELKRQEAIALQTNAMTNATLAVDQARIAQQVLVEQTQAKAEAEARELAQKQEMAALDRESAAIQTEVNNAAKELETAEKEYAEAIKECEANFTSNKINEMWSDVFAQFGGLFGTKDGAIPVDVKKAAVISIVDRNVDDAIRKGTIPTVKEADKARRQAEREARDLANKNSGQRGKEAAAYQRILNTNAKARSDADKQFLATYEKILKAQTASKEKVEAAQKAVEEAKKAQTESAKHLDEISKKVAALSDKLGLK